MMDRTAPCTSVRPIAPSSAWIGSRKQPINERCAMLGLAIPGIGGGIGIAMAV